MYNKMIGGLAYMLRELDKLLIKNHHNTFVKKKEEVIFRFSDPYKKGRLFFDLLKLFVNRHKFMLQ